MAAAARPADHGRAFASLDGLRGAAALAVVLGHFVNAFLPWTSGFGAVRHLPFEPALQEAPFTLFYSGSFAVAVFFVLSGFVLSVKFFQTSSVDVVVSSALRRYVRLAVPVLGSVVVAWFLLAAGLMRNHEAAERTGSTGWLSTFWNMSANPVRAVYEGTYGAFFRGSVDYNSSLWTMSYELAGSFIVFMLLALFGKVRRRWVVYAVFCLALGRDYYVAFVMGVALCDLWFNWPRGRQVLTRAGWPLLVLGLALAMWPPGATPGTLLYPLSRISGPSVLAPVPQLAQMAGAVCVLAAVLTLAPVARIFCSRPLQYLGRISFALYLLHVLLLGSLSCIVFDALAEHLSYGASAALTFAVSLPVMFLVSSAFTRYVDDNAILLSTRCRDLFVAPRRAQQAESGAPDDLSEREVPRTS